MEFFKAPAQQLAGTSIVQVAAEIRFRAAQIAPPFSTSKIIETCFPMALVTGFRLPPGVDEVVTLAAEGPTILYSRSLPVPDQRIAIAHGLAHLLFDDRSVCMKPGRAGVPHNEARADRFAAELLAPSAEVAMRARCAPSEDPEEYEIYLDQLEQLASAFGVPVAVIDSQLRLVEVTDKIVRRL